MGRRVLAVLVAIFFAAGVFAAPTAIAAKRDAGKTSIQEQQGRKHKSTKNTKKSSKLSKKKNKSTDLGSKKKAKNKKHQTYQA